MRVKLVSRASDLARLQTRLVQQALVSHHPGLTVDLLTRSSSGDRDQTAEIWQLPEIGVFSADLSGLLLTGEADVAVHSWKDLPVQGPAATVVGATLPRADPRDVLVLRRDAVAERPVEVRILTSSPRRAWQAQTSLADLLPWDAAGVVAEGVRGNVPTRLEKLAASDAHGLVVAKAALDRLLSDQAEPSARQRVAGLLQRFLWMVLPLSEFPTAPAQGAVAAEVAADRPDILHLAAAIDDASTREAVEVERTILAGYGGGCRAAIGATVLVRSYGRITSARGRLPSGETFSRRSLESSRALPPAATPADIWPRPEERQRAIRRPLPVVVPDDDRGWWISRNEALPLGVTPDQSRIIWAAGIRTWRRLASRGFWVNGCADGLGDGESPGVDALAGRTMRWLRFSHAGTTADDAVTTYVVDTPLPADLSSRAHFFWTSGTLFLDALGRHPEIGHAWHGCGPGRTFRTISEALGDDSRVSIWLDYEQWLQHLTR